MQVKPFADPDQHLPPPEGRLIGFADSKADLDAIIAAFRTSGHPCITVWSGSAGTEELKDLDEDFFFSDPEYLAIEFAIKELEGGHSCLAVEVEDRDAAASLAETATRLGGHGFRYIGPWISERFTK